MRSDNEKFYSVQWTDQRMFSDVPNDGSMSTYYINFTHMLMECAIIIVILQLII